MKYDYLVVGAGLFGAAFAQMAKEKGKRVLVIDKRKHIAGNIYTEDVGGIAVHRYGAHIFHTDDEEVWQYANRFATFNRFTNAPLAKYQDRLYHMPFNMNTFYAMWGVTKPNEAREIIERQRKEITGEPQNLEEQAISLVGRDIYEALVRGYSEKQWGRPCRELPAFIIRRLPVRFTYDNNYFNDRYQGIPDAGYTAMVEKMLDGIEVRLNVDFLQHWAELTEIADKIVYTGPIDQYYDQCFGALNYRSLRFETQDLPVQDYQGNAVINDTNADVPYTRVIEHKHFAYGQADVLNLPHTVVTYEYPADWKQGDEPYYPVNDAKNGALYEQYRQKAAGERNVIFGGRLGQYRYLDMDDTLRAAIDCARKELQEGGVTVRLAIVEDDDKVRQQLQTYVLQYFQGRENDVEIRLFADGDEILEDYAADYDLIFLDIQMKRLDGLATAERIRERDEDVYLVFITNLANYAIRGYAVHALDFILKPVNFLMLRQVLMSVERLLDQKPKRYITLPTDTGLTRLDVSQITYVETDGHAVSIYTEKGTYRLRQSMRGMEELLGKYGFFRCNSCYLVNLRHVERVENGGAIVGGRALTISRPRYKAFMEALTKYLGGAKV